VFSPIYFISQEISGGEFSFSVSALIIGALAGLGNILN